MSEAKFTKGEWYVPQTDGCTPLQVVAKDAKRSIVMFSDEPYEHTPEDKFNFNLIAAAPSMYAMLEEVSKELYNLIDEVNDQRLSHIHASSLNKPDLHDGETIHNIQLLLAKARGE